MCRAIWAIRSIHANDFFSEPSPYLVPRLGNIHEIPVLHLLPRPLGFTQKLQARFNIGIKHEASHRNPIRHFFPSVFLHEVINDRFQCYSVEWIARMHPFLRRRGRRCFRWVAANRLQIFVGIASHMKIIRKRGFHQQPPGVPATPHASQTNR